MIIQAIILGIIQGLTEFLPVSSSAHLYLIPYFFDWDYRGLGFDVALHWGTLAAVLFVFRQDYWRYLKAFFLHLPTSARFQNPDSLLAWFLIVGSLPAAVFGVILREQAETLFRHPLITALTLAGFGFILWLADRKAVHDQPLEQLSWMKVLGIGLAQAIAIVPGVSRSGATITAGLLCKLSRQAAARFSFLLSGPIIFGAGLVTLPEITGLTAPLVAGFLAAAGSGAFAIKFLLKYLISKDFRIFVWYRYALAVAVLLTLL
ncbi:MAG: undecaprenyl-diphosphate phosphatase [Candidatus Doudnabacteria bacterium]|nr:undecaprenyl-diphosphate phosphatase [Candidatus Doudnabacteria bacterium]